MNLSIIIPVFNEINSIQQILKKIIKDTPKIKKKIIVVDDFSSDGTREWLIKKKKEINITVVLKEKNEGKGSAVLEGLKYTKSNDIILIQDGDLEYFPKDINKLYKEIKKGYDIVLGNRFHKFSHYHYKSFALANFFISKFISILYLSKVSDAAVCYKMFKRSVIDNIVINSNDFMFDFEFVCKILKKKTWKISEVSISYKGRTFEEGKKISWIDGFRALLVILKLKLFY